MEKFLEIISCYKSRPTIVSLDCDMVNLITKLLPHHGPQDVPAGQIADIHYKSVTHCFDSLETRLRSADLKYLIPGPGLPRLKG